jgi:hypothetical protein
VLHFAAKLRGNNRGEVFRAAVPSGSPLLNFPFPDSRFQDSPTLSPSTTTYTSAWAEVAFFVQQVSTLDTTSDATNGNAPKLPLYTLFMRQKLAVPNSDTVAGAVPLTQVGVPASYAECSFYNDNATNLSFNGPQELTMPSRRMGVQPGAVQLQGATTATSYQTLAQELNGATPANLQAGSDVLLTDVISFDVQLLVDGNTQFQPLALLGYTMNNNGFPAGTWVFDTWSSRADNLTGNDYSSWATTAPQSSNAIPLYQIGTNPPISIKAVQVLIRIWDERTQQTRQTSVIVDL